MSAPLIEKLRWFVLDCPGVPYAHVDCRRLHPHRECDGDGCASCEGTGVGPVQGKRPTYCPCCHATSLCGRDSRLDIQPGDMPPPPPPRAADLDPELVDRKGRLCRMNWREFAEAERQRKAKERAQLRATRKYVAAKTKKRQAERKAAARAAEKARPKYVAPWKQPKTT
jgi:hypothetical protein